MVKCCMLNLPSERSICQILCICFGSKSLSCQVFLAEIQYHYSVLRITQHFLFLMQYSLCPKSILTLSQFNTHFAFVNTHFVMPFLLFQLSHFAFPFRSSIPGRAVLQSPSDAWVVIVIGTVEVNYGELRATLCLS